MMIAQTKVSPLLTSTIDDTNLKLRVQSFWKKIQPFFEPPFRILSEAAKKSLT